MIGKPYGKNLIDYEALDQLPLYLHNGSSMSLQTLFMAFDYDLSWDQAQRI